MSNFLAGAGVFVSVLAAAGAMVWGPSRQRSVAMLVALVLIPVLILGDQWHSAEIADLRHHTARLAALAVVALFAVAALTAAFRRKPMLLPLAIIAAVPFRIPIHAGGQEANLLVPLYLVIAGGVLAKVWEQWEEYRGRASAGGVSPGATGPAAGRLTLLPKVLAGVLVLYAIQSVYSEDFSRALQNVAFFYVPFALAFTLLASERWDRDLLVRALWVAGIEALVFVLFGFWEYADRHLIWNSEVIQSNDFHRYFRVNSLFWDPNVYGRFLALTITAIVAALLWARNQRLVFWLGALVAVLWLGLITTFSQSSFVALLVGLAALAALRWTARWTIAVFAAAALAAALFVVAAGGSLKINLSTETKLNKDTSGRANLVKEGIALFGDRPLWGYGSGSFSVAYKRHRTGGNGQLTVSHTEPVTVAAEQGAIGLIAYLALLASAFLTLTRGFMRTMPGLRGPPPGGGVREAARAAIFACFLALIAHTMAYAGFLEDPLTWALLAIGSSLALTAEPVATPRAGADPEREAVASPAQAPA